MNPEFGAASVADCLPVRQVHARVPRRSRNLFASDHRIALDFDLGIRTGQRRDGDESAAREIVTEHLPADLREPIAITNVGNEYGHLNHVAELAARLLQRTVEILEKLPDLTFEVACERLAGVVHRRGLPGKPYRPASFGNHGFRIAPLLRTFSLEVILCLSQGRKGKEPSQRCDAD